MQELIEAAKAAVLHFEGDELHDEGAFDPECQDCLTLERLRSALSNAETHLPAVKAAGGWRAIESAPKDGTALLILADGVVSQACYQGPSDGAMYSGSVSRYHWFCETSCRSIYDLNVTHWMPLPPPPGSLALGAMPEGGEERGASVDESGGSEVTG